MHLPVCPCSHSLSSIPGSVVDIHFRVYDDDLIGKDFLGQAFAQVALDKPQSLKLPLQESQEGAKKISGAIYVKFG